MECNLRQWQVLVHHTINNQHAIAAIPGPGIYVLRYVEKQFFRYRLK